MARVYVFLTEQHFNKNAVGCCLLWERDLFYVKFLEGIVVGVFFVQRNVQFLIVSGKGVRVDNCETVIEAA